MRLIDVLDVAVVAVLLWIGIASLRRSRARFALLGAGVLGVVYLAAGRLDLQLTATLLQGFVAVVVVFVVVAFQEDLRRLFERIALWGLRRRTPILPQSAVDTLVRAVTRMSAERTGALLVIPGTEPLDRVVDGGFPLDAWPSEPLLLSLFDPSSPGHDGAVIVSGNRATRFGVHLPLSTDHHQIGPGGTRHAAALGLSEHSDAFVIVVSEERGTVSVARDGELRTLSGPEALAAEVAPFLDRNEPRSAGRFARVRGRWPEGVVAVAVAIGLWFLVVPGATVIELRRAVPVQIENLPDGFVLDEVEPAEVEVTLSGRRRLLLLEDLDDVTVHVDALLAKLGRRTFQVSVEDVEHPEGIRVLAVTPKKVRISLEPESS